MVYCSVLGEIGLVVSNCYFAFLLRLRTYLALHVHVDALFGDAGKIRAGFVLCQV